MFISPFPGCCGANTANFALKDLEILTGLSNGRGGTKATKWFQETLDKVLVQERVTTDYSKPLKTGYGYEQIKTSYNPTDGITLAITNATQDKFARAVLLEKGFIPLIEGFENTRYKPPHKCTLWALIRNPDKVVTTTNVKLSVIEKVKKEIKKRVARRVPSVLRD